MQLSHTNIHTHMHTHTTLPCNRFSPFLLHTNQVGLRRELEENMDVINPVDKDLDSVSIMKSCDEIFQTKYLSEARNITHNH